MASEVKIKVRGENDTRATFRDANGDLRSLKMTAEDVKGTLDAFNTKSGQVRGDLAKLDQQILNNKKSLRELGSAFAQAGSDADRLDIQKKMDEIGKALESATRVHKLKLTELVDVETDRSSLESKVREAGKGIGAKLLDGIKSAGAGASGALDGVASELGTSMGGRIGMFAAPAILQGIGGAISAGAGAAALGGGIAAAIFSDSELKAEGKRIGKSLFGQITQSAHTAFADPLKREFSVLEKYGNEIASQWKDAFEGLAPSLEPVITNLARGVTELSGSFANIAGNSGPALEQFSADLADVATDVGSLLETLASSDSAAQGLHDLVNIIDLVVVGIDKLVAANDAIPDWLKDIFEPAHVATDALSTLGEMFGVTGGEATDYGDASKDAAADTQIATDALESERQALVKLADTLRAQTDPVFALQQAQQDLADAQEAYTKAVKKSGKGSDEAQDALKDLTNAALDLEGASGKLGDSFTGELSPSLRATLKAAGLTEGQIEALEGSFKDAKKAGDNFAKNYKANIQASGAKNSKTLIDQAAAAAKNYAGTYYANIMAKIAYREGGLASGGIASGVPGQSAAGNTQAGALTWVGEHGPELLALPSGSRVYSAGDSARMASSSASGGGSQYGALARTAPTPRSGGGGVDTPTNLKDIVLKLEMDGKRIAEAILKYQQILVADQFGGNVQAAYGKAYAQ